MAEDLSSQIGFQYFGDGNNDPANYLKAYLTSKGAIGGKDKVNILSGLGLLNASQVNPKNRTQMIESVYNRLSTDSTFANKVLSQIGLGSAESQSAFRQTKLGPASGVTAAMRANDPTGAQAIYDKIDPGAPGSSLPSNSSIPGQIAPIKPTGVPVAAQSATNLWEFYTKQGQALPSVQQRAPLYADYGGQGTYTGTAEQNNFLLAKLKGGLPATKAPGSTDQVTPSGQVQTPTPTVTTGDISGAQGATKGLGVKTDLTMKGLIDQMPNTDSQRKSFLSSWLEDQDKIYESVADTRAKLEKQYDIKSKLAEIDALGSDYNKKKAAMEAQMNDAVDQLATTGFISRASAAIERRYAPELNRLSAEINFKSGLLTQSRDLIDQAVKDATADQKFLLDQSKMFYDMNMDEFDRLDDRYKFAYTEFMKQSEREYDRAFAEKKLIADLAEKNVNAGITLNDTYASALAKFTAAGGEIKTTTSTTKTTEQQFESTKPTYDGGTLPLTEKVVTALENIGFTTSDLIEIQNKLNAGYSLKQIAQITSMPTTMYNELLKYIQA